MGATQSVVVLSSSVSLFSVSAAQVTHSLETSKEYLGISAFTLLLACLCSYSIQDVHGGGEEKRIFCFVLLAMACFLPLFGFLIQISKQAYIRRQNDSLRGHDDGGDSDDNYDDGDDDGVKCVVCAQETCECVSGGCPGGGDQDATA